jgi:DNA-directed RNA polymerase subunit E'/Rpb7
MLFHDSVVEKIVRICENYGGYREQKRLKDELRKLVLESYTQETGNVVLVLGDDLKKALEEFNKA